MNHTLESRLTTLTNFIIYNSLTLWNNYTKTQTYMQCGTMSEKTTLGHLGVHNKTHHIMGMLGHSH